MRNQRPRAIGVVAAALVAIATAAACITRDPNVDTGDTVASPTSPTTTTPTPTPSPAPGTVTVAYTQDIAPILRADCQRCHTGARPDAGYSVDTYELVMREVRPGDARSRLVSSTQNRGSMYRYWSGTAATKAELVRTWVVENGAARDR